jgi:hypothetical protein
VDSDGNGYIDRVYVATDKGFMYKVNLPDDPSKDPTTGITNCVINTDFVDEKNNTVPTAQRYHPIYASPAIMVDNEFGPSGTIKYRVRLFFGTGDSPYYDENINMANTQYHFFAYVDEDDKGGNGSSVILDWFYELPEGQRIFASAFAAAGNIYFGTATSETEDPCKGPNQGVLHGFTKEGQSVMAQAVGDTVTSPVVEDEHLYYRTADGIGSVGGSNYNNPGPTSGVSQIKIKSWKEIY